MRSALMPPSTWSRKRLLKRTVFFGLKAMLILSGSNRCSSCAPSACGSAGVKGKNRGIRARIPGARASFGTRTSFDGPSSSPEAMSKWKASMSSTASASLSPAATTASLLATCTSCHLARTLVTFSTRTARVRPRAALMWTRPYSSKTGGKASPASVPSRGRSKSGRGMATSCRAGRREVAKRWRRWRSLGGAATCTSLSRGYSIMTLPVKTCSTCDSFHCIAGTSSGAKTTCSDTVSNFSTVKSWGGGGSCDFFFVFLASSGWSRTTCLPT
mmetsp:Transcript_85961/g.248218  ORF Transcript_85961/g.248218 Transcript_85961/m.248218 type:complete len:272 (+) Transcript_85961:311-1126(+)